MGLLDGEVVLITGAGGGIGRCHALSFARDRSRVVVNNLGGTRDGSGSGETMADKEEKGPSEPQIGKRYDGGYWQVVGAGMAAYANATDDSNSAYLGEHAPATYEVSQTVTLHQATRYAMCSRDENPIHTDPDAAKAAGLPGVILHGLSTMAFAQRDIIHRSAEGDPSRLKSLSVRFAKPVFKGQTRTLKVRDEAGTLNFITENDDGQVVISNGRAVIA